MLIFVRGVFFLAFLVSVAWAAVRPGYDSIAATAGALAAFLASYFLGEKSNPRGQDQRISNRSIGIQAAGNIKVGKVIKKKSK